MKKGLLLIFLMCLVISSVMAQKRPISGLVTEKATGEPLPGVTVIEKGTSIGTVTDLDGEFKLSVNVGATLQFSFIGMQTQDVVVGNLSMIHVALESVVSQVDEIVVVGYGTQKKANLTGAVASVDTKVLEARPIADVGRGLQGTTAGLNVVIPSGEIGSDPIIKIRGQLASIRG